MILIDIENLMASPDPATNEVEVVVDALRNVVPGFDYDQKVVAYSHHAAHTVPFAFPTARHLWRSGPDGADLALREVLENERVDERFECVTICSGDGIFASTTAWLAHSGVEVTAVSLSGHLAARLQVAARHVTLIPVTPSIAVGTAS